MTGLTASALLYRGGAVGTRDLRVPAAEFRRWHAATGGATSRLGVCTMRERIVERPHASRCASPGPGATRLASRELVAPVHVRNGGRKRSIVTMTQSLPRTAVSGTTVETAPCHCKRHPRWFSAAHRRGQSTMAGSWPMRLQSARRRTPHPAPRAHGTGPSLGKHLARTVQPHGPLRADGERRLRPRTTHDRCGTSLRRLARARWDRPWEGVR